MSMPEMIFLIAVTVILPISVLSLLFSYQKARLKAKRSASENELTTSELQHMIDSAVTEATAELQDRVYLLEERLRLLGPASDDLPDHDTGSSKTLGRVTRE
ncbi:MAG TPA: hypothetical protein VGA18_03940 [Rhodothermales bacterium]